MRDPPCVITMVASGGAAAVFVYGSLMSARVLRTLLGRVPTRTPATLPGFRRASVLGAPYPAIVRDEHGGDADAPPGVCGMLLADLTPREREILDLFEDADDDEYDKLLVHVRAPPDDAPVRASAYVWREAMRHRLIFGGADGGGAPEWSLEAFERAESLEPFLQECEAFVAAGYQWLDDEPAPAAARAAVGADGGAPLGAAAAAATGAEGGGGSAFAFGFALDGAPAAEPVPLARAAAHAPPAAAVPPAVELRTATATPAAPRSEPGGAAAPPPRADEEGAPPPPTLVAGWSVRLVRGSALAASRAPPACASPPGAESRAEPTPGATGWAVWSHVPPDDAAARLVPAMRSVDGSARLDVLPGVYEGGFKTWEGALDLCAYVHTHARALLDACAPPAGADGLRCAELGCGSALPSLVLLREAARLGAGGARGAARRLRELWLQDFNAEVLEQLAEPNARLNGAGPSPRIRLLAGDWRVCAPLLLGRESARHAPAGAGGEEAGRAPKRARGAGGAEGGAQPAPLDSLDPDYLDLVLSAETIYSEAALEGLWLLLRTLLRPGSGCALVGAKSYYFGVGGGVAQLVERVRADVDGAGRPRFEAERVATIEDGASNRREVLLIRALHAASSIRGAGADAEPFDGSDS